MSEVVDFFQGTPVYERLALEAGAAAFYPKRHLDVEVIRSLIEQRHTQTLAA